MVKILVLFLCLIAVAQPTLVNGEDLDNDYYYSMEETGGSNNKRSALPDDDDKVTHVSSKNLSGNVELTTLEVLEDDGFSTMQANQGLSNDETTTTTTIKVEAYGAEVMDVFSGTSGPVTTTEKVVIVTPFKVVELIESNATENVEIVVAEQFTTEEDIAAAATLSHLEDGAISTEQIRFAGEATTTEEIAGTDMIDIHWSTTSSNEEDYAEFSTTEIMREKTTIHFMDEKTTTTDYEEKINNEQATINSIIFTTTSSPNIEMISTTQENSRITSEVFNDVTTTEEIRELSTSHDEENEEILEDLEQLWSTMSSLPFETTTSIIDNTNEEITLHFTSSTDKNSKTTTQMSNMEETTTEQVKEWPTTISLLQTYHNENVEIIEDSDQKSTTVASLQVEETSTELLQDIITTFNTITDEIPTTTLKEFSTSPPLEVTTISNAVRADISTTTLGEFFTSPPLPVTTIYNAVTEEIPATTFKQVTTIPHFADTTITAEENSKDEASTTPFYPRNIITEVSVLEKIDGKLIEKKLSSDIKEAPQMPSLNLVLANSYNDSIEDLTSFMEIDEKFLNSIQEPNSDLTQVFSSVEMVNTVETITLKDKEDEVEDIFEELEKQTQIDVCCHMSQTEPPMWVEEILNNKNGENPSFEIGTPLEQGEISSVAIEETTIRNPKKESMWPEVILQKEINSNLTLDINILTSAKPETSTFTRTEEITTMGESRRENSTIVPEFEENSTIYEESSTKTISSGWNAFSEPQSSSTETTSFTEMTEEQTSINPTTTVKITGSEKINLEQASANPTATAEFSTPSQLSENFKSGTTTIFPTVTFLINEDSTIVTAENFPQAVSTSESFPLDTSTPRKEIPISTPMFTREFSTSTLKINRDSVTEVEELSQTYTTEMIFEDKPKAIVMEEPTTKLTFKTLKEESTTEISTNSFVDSTLEHTEENLTLLELNDPPKSEPLTEVTTSRSEQTTVEVDDDADDENMEDPEVSGTIRGNIVHFSVKITDQDTSFFIPPDALMIFLPPNTLNITWKSSYPNRNNSLLLDAANPKNSTLSIVKGKRIHIHKPEDKLGQTDSIIPLDGGVQVHLSNSFFTALHTIAPEDASPSTPHSTSLTAEILGGCIAAAALVAGLAYYSYKKLRSQSGNIKFDNHAA